MQLGALTQGASIVLYEGSPGYPAGAVWEVAARTRADVMLHGRRGRDRFGQRRRLAPARA